MNINESIKPQGVYTLKVSDPRKAPEAYDRVVHFVANNPINFVAPKDRARHYSRLQELIKAYEREALIETIQFTNLVPTVGRAVLAKILVGDVTYTGEINKVALGDGTVLPANGDTVLDNETYRQDVTSVAQVNNIAYLTSFIAAKLCRIPSRNPASTAPGSDPIPPTTTTTKLRTRKSMPM